MDRCLRFFFLPFCLLLLLLASCTAEQPSHVIAKGKMERILYDYHLAQGMAESQGGDVEANRYLYVQKVFEKHRVTEADFDSSMVWYSAHAAHLKDMYDHIGVRLERESDAAGLNITEFEQYSRYTAEGDTANVWAGHDMLFLHGNREENLYTVVIPADSTFLPGDHFMLHTTNRFIVQDKSREGFILLQVQYENDSVVGSTIMVNGDQDAKLTIPADRMSRTSRIRALSCTFYYAFDEAADEAFRLWVVSNPILLRYHSPEVQQADTLSVQVPDSLEADTLREPAEQPRGERLSPQEFRGNRQVNRKINVVQKRRVVLPAHDGRQQTTKPKR